MTYTCNDSGNTLINSSAIIPNWDSHSKNSVSAIYICLSGLKTTLSTIIFKQNATLDTVTGLLSLGFNFSTPGATIDFIKISYAIFLHSAFDLAVVKTIVDLADYSLTAAIGLNSGLPTLSTLNINAQRYSCNSPACPDICVNKPTCLTNKGNIYNRGCYICGLKQIWNGIKCVC